MKTLGGRKTQFTHERGGGKVLTEPGLAIGVRQAIQRYAGINWAEKAFEKYDQIGMDVPDVSKLSRIEKLELLAEYRQNVNGMRESLTNAYKIKKDEQATGTENAG